MASIPVSLLAVFGPPPLAALLAGLAFLAGEVVVRPQHEMTVGEVATSTLRWVPLVLSASLVAHLAGPDPLHMAALGAAALLLFLGDLLTVALLIAPWTQQPPHRVMAEAFTQSVRIEGIQYVVAVIAAVQAQERPWTALLLVVPTALIYHFAKTATELQGGTQHLLESIADTVDLRDAYTGGHSRRVTAYCAHILAALQVEGPDVALILAAARVHDIGKIAIPDAVLHKPGPLDPEERALMETHAARGAVFLQRYGDFGRGVKIVRHHHEAWDGSGYPDRLRGTQIPFGARVMAVADSYDAMTSDRPYRRGMPVETAHRILVEGRGVQWDPTIVDAFLHALATEPAAPRVQAVHTASAEPASGAA